MKKLFAAALLSSSLLLPACASGEGSDYAMNRVNDFVDILRCNLKAGAGIGVEYEWTRLAGVGVLYEYKVWAAGLANRELAYWNESIFFWGLLVMHHQETINSGIGGYYSGSYGWEFGKDGGNLIQLNDPKNPLDMINVRLTVMAGIGADIDLRVGEAIDFVVGLFQFDPADDDKHYSEMKHVDESETENINPKTNKGS